ncbi:ABC transporter substrate-binding protein [Chelatococcus reniformis]|uniref:Branched-chain amino acid ABC transporter substrate-binding protein n=1 Tax=Chelatococcus reniformis TaxID=1494448 RepID=A0A916UV90_9HYPH|nr:ABC transporter substrate-binding protein [Chelatococcus reniformis]GGC89340.1 branched-chain amino acid ABC transporter substrate-binding protein [Chelatococcus reniformis]
MKPVLTAVLALSLVAPGAAIAAEKKYDHGASDTEIRIGQTVPYSGPASYGGVIGRVQTAFFEQLNANGGINGRKVNLISLDDGYSPPKTVEATRRLVESEGVLATYYSMGTGPQAAVQKYLNSKKVPQLMVATGSAKWDEPEKFPWSTSALALYSTEAKLFAKWVLQNRPGAKIAILYQNDDLGRDYVRDFKAGLGDKAATLVVAESTYDITDPTIDSQMVKLAASGADLFYNVTVGKFVSQSIRKAAELGWKPLQYLVGSSASNMLINAGGPENAKGLRSLIYAKQPDAAEWANDPDIKAYQEFRAKYTPTIDPADGVGLLAYSGAKVLAELLKRCGDDLTHANLLKVATNLKDFGAIHLLPGIAYNMSPTDYEPIRALYLGEYDGKEFKRPEALISR